MIKITVQQGDISTFEADALIVNLFEGVSNPSGGTGAVDKALGGLITSEMQANQKIFTGKLKEALVLPTYGKLAARYVIVVGLGKADKLDAASLRRASAVAVQTCLKLKLKSAATLLNGAGIGGVEPQTAARLLAEGAQLAGYRFIERLGKKSYENDADPAPSLEKLTIVEYQADKLPAIEAGLQQADAIAEAVCLARDWVNDSPRHVTPRYLKAQAEQIKNLSCTILDFNAIKELNMGAFTIVAQGSDKPPYLIHLSYRPESPQKKVALVGKGITFDSGGLSLKTGAGMMTMKMDMAGAAAVLATMHAIAALGDLPVQVDAFVPTCENMPSGRSSKPGDIVTAMNGKTIEVNNTDAEGRLILADALTYAQRQCDPDEIIDLATLTGACIVALGKAAAGIMGTDEDLIARLRSAGEPAGEKFWPLPLYEEYQAFLKSDAADIINAGSKGEAGSSAGGMFLKEFIDAERSWVHLDIAGPAWTTEDAPEVPKGGTGFGVRTLLYYLYGW